MIVPNRRGWLTQVLAAFTSAAAFGGPNPLTAPGAKTMNTHAIGRHLIDFPEGFGALAGNRVELYFGLDRDARRLIASLLAAQASAADFARRVRERAAALAAEQHETLARPMLICDQVVVEGQVHLLRSYEDSQLPHVTRSEVFCRIGDAIVLLEAQSYRVVPDEAELRLLATAAQTTAAATADAIGKGFGLGPVVIGAVHDQEIGTLNFRNPAFAERLFTLRINALTPNPDPGLLSRWDRNAPLLKGLAGGPSTIRRGAVTVAGMAGEELLTRGRPEGHPVLKFNAESRRDRPSFATPLLGLTLDTEPVGAAGAAAATVWAEDEAIATWDAVVRSIRLRPGSV